MKYLLGVCALLWSCSEGESPKQENYKEYFPLGIGYYQIYAVEETVYSGLNQSAFSAYDLKTEIVDSFTDLEGKTAYVIHRSKRANADASWEFIDTWSASVNSFQAVVKEGTTSFIRIAFPVYKNSQWNGNALNTNPEDIYVCEGAGVSFDLENDQSFDDCLVINQERYLDEVIKKDQQEVYARNVGLIYKKFLDIDYCDEGDCFGQQQITGGIEFIQVLKEYGEN